jgi:ribonuclease Z
VKITFIGTSSGKTSLNRFHSSLLLSSENYNLLIDVGDGISRALIANRINFNSINGILFTHLHPDHFSGFPALIVQMKLINRTEPLDVFIHDSLKNVVEEFLVRSYLLSERIGFEILYKTLRDNERSIISKNFFFQARKNSHLSNLEEFRNKYSSLSLYCASFLFESANKRVVYTSDIGSDEDLFLFNDAVPDIFISEITHLSPANILDKIIKLNPGKIYLTHLSDEDILALREILATLPPGLKKRIILAEDGLSFEI